MKLAAAKCGFVKIKFGFDIFANGEFQTAILQKPNLKLKSHAKPQTSQNKIAKTTNRFSTKPQTKFGFDKNYKSPKI